MRSNESSAFTDGNALASEPDRAVVAGVLDTVDTAIGGNVVAGEPAATIDDKVLWFPRKRDGVVRADSNSRIGDEISLESKWRSRMLLSLMGSSESSTFTGGNALALVDRELAVAADVAIGERWPASGPLAAIRTVVAGEPVAAAGGSSDVLDVARYRRCGARGCSSSSKLPSRM